MMGIDKKELTVGSKYQVMSIGKEEEEKTTTGTFLGFTTVGDCSGICIKLDRSNKQQQGKIRIIPSEIILTIDVLSKRKKKGKK